MRVKPIAWAIALLLPLAPHAAPDPELQLLREELQRIKADYERRIEALERRIVETDRAAAPPAPAAAPAQANTFNPEISAILAGTYTGLDQDPRQDPTRVAGRERRPQGFLPSGGEANPAARSFNLGESEVALTANIDHLFRGSLLFSLGGDNTLGVEEANIQTLGLGANLKFGRFFSAIGYANEQHAHLWDFADAALPYKAFFANQVGYDGLQFKWLAPTATFLEFGAEFGRAGGFPASDTARNKNGFLSSSLFAHAGDDVGVSHSWRAGLSVFNTQPKNRDYEDVDSTNTLVSNRFSGSSRTVVADFVWKWAPQGNARERSFKFQTEFFRRRELGNLTYDVNAASLGTASGGYRADPSGGYAQGVWQFMRGWRAGYRFDWLTPGSQSIALLDNGTLTPADLPLLRAFRPQRHSLMLDWSPSEFSTLRLQVARDNTRPGTTDNQVWLQYIMSMGAHGAHKF